MNECPKFDEFKSQLNTLVEAISKDAEKFYNKDNSTAGIRLRKGYKAIKQFVHEISNETLPKNVKK